MDKINVILQHVLTAYHCVRDRITLPNVIYKAVLGGTCLIPPDRAPWKPHYGLRVNVKKGELPPHISQHNEMYMYSTYKDSRSSINVIFVTWKSLSL